MLKLPKNNDLRYSISVDYDTEYSCDATCDDYCRCGTISNTVVNPTVRNAFGLADALGLPTASYNKKKPRITIDNAIDFLFVKQLLKAENFNTEVYSGYYGEELGPTTFDPGCNLDLYNQEDLTSRLHAALIMEHKFIPKTVSDVKNWVFEKVPTKLVQISNKTLNRERVEDYTSYLKYNEGMEKYFAPVCLTIGGKFRIVDGNHRFTAVKNVMKKDTCFIIKEQP